MNGEEERKLYCEKRFFLNEIVVQSIYNITCIYMQPKHAIYKLQYSTMSNTCLHTSTHMLYSTNATMLNTTFLKH